MSAFEPQLLASLPRMIRPKKRRAGLGCLRVFILPHTLVGVGMVFYALFLASMALFGEEANGRVFAHHEGTDDDGDPTYALSYSYRVDGTEYRGTSSVSRETFSRVSDGGVVRVVTFPPAPGLGPRIAGDAGRGRELLFIGVFALFWNGILSFFLWHVYGEPLYHRSLYRRGTPVAATVTEKKVDTGDDSVTHIVCYEFPAGGDAAVPGRKEGKVAVTKEEYEGIRVGDVLTALYHPRWPSMSLLYRFGGWEVVSG